MSASDKHNKRDPKLFSGWRPAPNVTVVFGGPQDLRRDAAGVATRRAQLAAAHPQVHHWQWLQQVHGTVVHSVSAATEPLTGDGLHTAEPGLALCVLTADCLPVLLMAHDSRTFLATEVGIAHAGWRGLAAGVLENCLAQFKGTPDTMVAVLGPAIGPCHFVVGADVLAAFQRQLPVAARGDSAAGAATKSAGQRPGHSAANSQADSAARAATSSAGQRPGHSAASSQADSAAGVATKSGTARTAAAVASPAAAVKASPTDSAAASIPAPLRRWFQPGPVAGKYYADLPGLARWRLQQAGVFCIASGRRCTYCEPDQLLSYRRDPQCGRMLSAIYLHPPD